jgi:putative oxygen-independent coproporphyrinogen III oxidase
MASRFPNYDPGFGVYVHWPFCLSKCPYCDFNSHVRAQPVDEARYVAAFRTELAHRAALAPGRTVGSIFFGGGTPSLMKPDTVGAILEAIGKHWQIAPDAEITLEANPTSVEAQRFKGYKAAGVNRVSLGVQAMNDPDLKALGRLHTAAEAMTAVGVASAIFDRFSFDLIYARPSQTPEAWRSELSEAVKRAGGHMSLYQLTIEPDTMFERLVAAGRLNAAGMPAYEISNHARAGQESRHNLIYWRYGEYAGVGPGAHGRLVTPRGRIAQSTEKHPEMWLTVVESDGNGLVADEVLTQEEQADEMLLMGLRLTEGIEALRFEAIRGHKLDEDRIATLIQDGMIEITDDGRIRVTTSGFPVLDAVVADLAA